MWVCETYVVKHLWGSVPRCAPLTCVVHHQPALCTTRGTYVCEKFCIAVHFGGAQCSFVLTRWCTKRFRRFVISFDCDGARYDVVSLAVWVCAPLQWNRAMLCTINLHCMHVPPSCIVQISNTSLWCHVMM